MYWVKQSIWKTRTGSTTTKFHILSQNLTVFSYFFFTRVFWMLPSLNILCTTSENEYYTKIRILGYAVTFGVCAFLKFPNKLWLWTSPSQDGIQLLLYAIITMSLLFLLAVCHRVLTYHIQNAPQLNVSDLLMQRFVVKLATLRSQPDRGPDYSLANFPFR